MWDWAHIQHLVLPAVTLSVIPMGIITRTVRGIVAEIMNQEFVVALRGKGLTGWNIFLHVVKNAAPNALAVMGLQLGYLMGGSILVETVFSWPGTGLLLNSAISWCWRCSSCCSTCAWISCRPRSIRGSSAHDPLPVLWRVFGATERARMTQHLALPMDLPA
jgi:peptide/nickel transport system permease protein